MILRNIVEVVCNKRLSEKYACIWVYLGVRTCELFLCFVAIVRVRAIMLTSLFSLFYVTGEFHRFLHRGRARISMIFLAPSSRRSRPVAKSAYCLTLDELIQ